MDFAIIAILIIFCFICFIIVFMCCHLICFSRRYLSDRRRGEIFRRQSLFGGQNGPNNDTNGHNVNIPTIYETVFSTSPPPSFSRAFSCRKPIFIDEKTEIESVKTDDDLPPTYQDYLNSWNGVDNKGFEIDFHFSVDLHTPSTTSTSTKSHSHINSNFVEMTDFNPHSTTIANNENGHGQPAALL